MFLEQQFINKIFSGYGYSNVLFFLIFRIRAEGNPLLTCPAFPMDFLKFQMMTLLKQAVAFGAHHIRDPIGGTNADLFV